MRAAALPVSAMLCFSAFCFPANAAEPALRRATIWDLVLGAPIAAQPSSQEFKGFACGSNGGAPRAPLTGWADFKRCPADADGLHEVYFEYDDEIEYIARAHDNEREISRWAGTHEVTFPVITSALFDDAGILKGIRLVTDPRPEHKNDITEADRKKREESYQLGGVMAARFSIEPAARLQVAAARRRRGLRRLAVHQAGLRAQRPRRRPPLRRAGEPLPQAGTERRQSAAADAAHAGPVRKLGAARGVCAGQAVGGVRF